MRALVCTKPGSVEYKEVARPALKKAHALLRIRRVGVCGTDLHAFEGSQPFFSYPRILGHELAAEIEDVDGTNDFKKGEAVTTIPYYNCGHCIACRNGKPNCCVNINVCGVHIDGGMTEFLLTPSHSLLRGGEIRLDELALIEPLAIGAHAVKRADVKAGEFVLVIGAGPIGLGTMEFARIQGANVIALEVNEARLHFCQQLKVELTVNPSRQNAFNVLTEMTNGDMPTVVIDATGNLEAINNGFQYMAHGGRYILIGLQKGEISFSHPDFHKREASLMSSRNATREDFEYVMNSVKNGLVNPSVYITHRVKFQEVKDNFERWLDPSNGVIKAIIEMD